MLAAFVPVAVAAAAGLPHAPQPAPTTTRGDHAARIARTYLKTPYVWGGASTTGVDCSGLVYAVYRRLGVTVPHQSQELWTRLHRVHRPQPGDILAFGGAGYSDHVGIYLGRNRFIHAVGAGKGVQIGYLHGRKRHRGYLGAVRPAASRSSASSSARPSSALVSGFITVIRRQGAPESVVRLIHP